MRTETLDIRVPRNGDYNEEWQLSDNVNDPIDLTDVSLQLAIRLVAGQGAIVANAIINLHSPTTGQFTVRIDGTALTAITGPGETVRLAYDLRLTYVDGIKAIPVAGQIILTPGVTY